jgi:hypothetical protein
MFLLQILETLFTMEERKKKRSTCSVMRFLLGRRASQLGCHTLHKQVDAERSQRDAQPWSGASQVIADEGTLAIRIPAAKKDPVATRGLLPPLNLSDVIPTRLLLLWICAPSKRRDRTFVRLLRPLLSTEYKKSHIGLLCPRVIHAS